MKITSFDPFIDTKKANDIIKVFEELGFERSHTKDGIEIADRNDKIIRMKNANGFHLDLLQSDADIPCDMVGIRMNVDNFDEAYKILQKHGFKNIYGDETVATKTSKAAMMISPSGFRISIIPHLK